MNPPDILTALHNALKNSDNISYVEDVNIHLGKVSNEPNYPAIVIDPGTKKKLSDTTGGIENWAMTVSVIGGIKVYDESKQIVGDANIKGLEDFENDVKKALSEDHTLGGTCLNVSILDSSPDDGQDYPLRGFLMTIEILYRQNRTTRE